MNDWQPIDISADLARLKAEGNYRAIPDACGAEVIDLSSNDYLGLGADMELRSELLHEAHARMLPLSSSASRLLAECQEEYDNLERLLQELYPGRKALLFNSGYHANTGIISAIANKDTLVLADRLVHASIIDGILLSRATLMRWRHNDYDHLEKLLRQQQPDFKHVLIVAESVYSMDGDKADIERLIQIKRAFPGAMLYIDEAHAFGVEGPHGLGLVEASGKGSEVDVMMGTFSKALGSVGAFAIVSDELRQYLVNHARSFIFSTALPPVNAMWTRRLIEKMLSMDAERDHLRSLASRLAAVLGTAQASHIQPLVIGDARATVELSKALLQQGVKALPIRRPTVPPGTERLRFSLSAAITHQQMDDVLRVLQDTYKDFRP